MIQYDNTWWLPDDEKHLQHWMSVTRDRRDGRYRYQGRKYDAALRYCKARRVAVDVGAHVGLWSYWMARDFESLIAFEPMAEHRACWQENMKAFTNTRLEACALGAEHRQVYVRRRTPGSSGDTGVDPVAELSSLRASVDTEGEMVEQKMLDDFKLEIVDFLKMDCEGYEVFVVRGGVDTLSRCKPCIIVEQKPETGLVQRYGIGVTDAVVKLKLLGAKVREVIQGDYILSWDR